MKPNFALNFTDDSIALLHRTKRGWAEIGSTAFDVDDLPAALAALKAKAEALAPQGFSTKLLIPNSQIKYLVIPAAGPDQASREAQITAGLEGQTPYAVSELVWDHVAGETGAQVAVIARETLDEAEGFATTHGFNPVSFAATPPEGAFEGEVWFGPSGFAQTILKPGETVERDHAPRHGAAKARAAADPAPEPAPQPLAQPDPRPEPEPAPEPEPLPQTTPRVEPEIEPQPEPQPEPEPPGIPDPAVDAPEPAPLEIPPAPREFESRQAPAAPDMPVDPARIAATLSAGDPPAGPAAGPASVIGPDIPDADEAPIALDVHDDIAEAASAETAPLDKAARVATNRIVDPSVDDDLPPMPSGAALAAFGNRLGKGDAPAATRPVVVAPSVETDRNSPRPSGKAAAERSPGLRPPPKFSYETPGEKPASPATKALRGMAGMVTSPTIPGGGKRAKVIASAAAASADGGSSSPAPAAARSQSGLGTRPMPVRGKPRHLGLILTGLLLIMLALAAGLSSFYVSWNGTDDGTTVETAAGAPAPDADLPAPEDEMLADLQEDGLGDQPEAQAPLPEEAAAAPAPEGEAIAGAETETAPEAAASEQATAEATTRPEPPPANVIAGDPAPGNLPGTEAQDEIFLAASDTRPNPVDAAALPPPSARVDLPPAAQAPPPPFGTVYQFDENGLIRPTPEGIATPEGVLLFAGSPELVPPSRPESITAAAAAAAASAPVVSPEATASDTPAEEPAVIIPADPALADARPLPRPASLAPAEQPQDTATDDGASLAPEEGSRIAGIRPVTRPASIVAENAASGLLLPASASTSGNLALIAPNGAGSPIGLAISRRPAARPDDMASAVEAAVAAAIRLPDPEPPAAEITPETEEEPELAAAPAPRIPSSANVAKQATIRNAIDLRDMNLIGVYGTSADRYALVRNPNGRYIKVSVGDRLDGGRVAAITASELRYEKRGRMVVLSLPNS